MAVLASCSGLLREQPTTGYMENSAYRTEEALDALVYGAYRQTFSSVASTILFYHLGCSSELIHWKRGNRTGRTYEQLVRGTLYADQDQGNSMLRSLFAAIQDCNIILEGLDDSPVGAGFKKEIEAEIRFLRAVNYFYAVRMFGDVPLYTRPVKSDSDAYVKRTSFKEVYAQIVDDFSFAAENMRDEARQKEVTGDNGRAHKYAATAFLSQVWLQIGSLLASPDDQAFGTVGTGYVRPDFSGMGVNSAEEAFKRALDAADDVIEHGGYELEPDFRTLFKWEPEEAVNAYSSKERIFVMQNTTNGGSEARFTMNTLPNFLSGTVQGQTLHSCSTAGYVRPFRMVLDKWSRTYGGTLQKSGDLEFYTTCNDPRYDASYYTSYKITSNTSGKRYDPPLDQYVYPEDNKDDPYFKKYFCSLYDADASYSDMYVIRLADIYLVAAEASAQLGQPGRLGDAYDYIEVLHARARRSRDGAESEQPKWTRGQFASKEELVTAIFWESVFETHGECHEWFNSHRHGAGWMLKNIYDPVHNFLMAPEQESYREQWMYDLGIEVPRTLQNSRCSLLCEYPEYELQYNQALTSKDQNVFNSTNASYNVSASGNGTNESYDDEDEVFSW